MEKEKMKETAQTVMKKVKKATKSFLSLDKDILTDRITDKIKADPQKTYYGLLVLIAILFILSLASGLFTLVLAAGAVALARLVCEFIKNSSTKSGKK